MDETIRRYGILVTAPGEIYQYSNLGYGILGYVISRVSGKSYAQFMQSEIFLPLGMTHTSVGIGKELEEYAAQRYGADQRPVPFYEFDHPAASAIFSSAHDLIRFGMFHLKCHLPDQRRILKDVSIDRMQNDEDAEYPGKEYRLGFRVIEDDCGYRTASHAGGMEGVSTEIKIVPTENIALVVLCNNRDRRIYDLDNEILAALLPRYAENLMKRGKELEETGPVSFSPLSALLGEWKGEIRTYRGCGFQRRNPHRPFPGGD
jgi:CubicO group peptidase (beta-lactamase class C family)